MSSQQVDLDGEPVESSAEEWDCPYCGEQIPRTHWPQHIRSCGVGGDES